jgi:hypothetical protein
MRDSVRECLHSVTRVGHEVTLLADRSLIVVNATSLGDQVIIKLLQTEDS